MPPKTQPKPMSMMITPAKSEKRKWESCLIANTNGREKLNWWGFKTESPHLMVTPFAASETERSPGYWAITHVPTGRGLYSHDWPLDDPQPIIDLANEVAVIEGVEWGFHDTTYITRDPARFQPVRDRLNKFRNAALEAEEMRVENPMSVPDDDVPE